MSSGFIIEIDAWDLQIVLKRCYITTMIGPKKWVALGGGYDRRKGRTRIGDWKTYGMAAI